MEAEKPMQGQTAVDEKKSQEKPEKCDPNALPEPFNKISISTTVQGSGDMPVSEENPEILMCEECRMVIEDKNEENTSASDVLMCNECRLKEEKKAQNLVEGQLSMEGSAKEDDPLNVFMQMVMQVIRNLPPNLVNEAKMKVQEVIGEFQEKALKEIQAEAEQKQ